MTNPIHLLTVAALLLVAFLTGAVVGTLLRLIVIGARRKPAVVVDTPAEAAPVAPPLVVTPVIAPLPIAPTPVPPPPAEVPVPDFAATLIALADEAPPAAFVEAVRPQPVSKVQSTVGVAGATPALAMQPARTAGETTSGLHVAAPLHENLVEHPAESTGQRSAEVIPFPSAVLEPVTERPADLMVGGEAVSIVDASDMAGTEPVVTSVEVTSPLETSAASEDDFLIVGEEAFAVPEVEPLLPAVLEAASDTVPVPAITANAAVAAVAMADLPVPEVVTSVAAPQAAPATEEVAVTQAPEPMAAAPAMEQSVPASAAAQEDQPEVEPPRQESTAQSELESRPEPVVAPAIAQTPPVATQLEVEPERIVSPSSEPVDEDAAMRAIEGNWSPRRTPVRKPRPAEAPEGVNQAVAASARAVTAARRTAEAVIAEVAEVQAEVKAEAGRPAGLEQPRDGRKDDLTHIIGVLPVIETALNKLGIYHFDQVGGLTDENIGWIEGHLGVPGRISRELWREQARELSAVLRPRRAAEK